MNQMNTTVTTLDNLYMPSSGIIESLKKQLPTLRDSLTHALAKGNLRRLSMWELLLLKYAGRRDGKAGLPKETASGEWTSAMLRKEVEAFSEYSNDLWGQLQITLHDAYATCDTLIDAILHLNELIARGAPPELPKDDPAYHIRKRGEEALAETQVVARRKREAEAGLRHRREDYARMQHAVRRNYEELSTLHGYILEAQSAASLVCERVMHHAGQRVSVYWRSAYRVHPESNRMPASMEPSFPRDAEEGFKARHAHYDATVRELLEFYDGLLKKEQTEEDIKEETAV